MATGQPVSNAYISFYGETDPDYTVRQLGDRVQTNAEGVVRFVLNRSKHSVVAVVEEDNRLTVVSGVSFYQIDTNTISDFLYLDRKLLQPNETLYVKGRDLVRLFTSHSILL